jgi:hypothetical protein
MNRIRRLVSLPLLVALAAPALATAATLQVSNSGIDDPNCGIKAPCRSLRLAIANAAPGDAIVVGPGFYSDDLDHDGVFAEPGEETRTALFIDKPVTITSTFGASSTVLQVSVFIEESNVVLGRLNEGFTISTDLFFPLVVISPSVLPLVDVVVAGNVILRSDPQGAAEAFIARTSGRLEDNRVLGLGGCAIGFWLAESVDMVAARNSVVGCDKGFLVESSPNLRLIRNTAVGNSFASANGVGFDISRGVAEFSGNASIGNGTGVRLFGEIPIFRDNAFAGSITNCGVAHSGATKLAAIDNWWGAPSGPGADPADDVCDFNGSVTFTTPFLTTDPSTPLGPLR